MRSANKVSVRCLLPHLLMYIIISSCLICSHSSTNLTMNTLSPTPSPQPFNSHLVFETNDGRRGRGRREESKAGVNRGHWSTEENKRYHWFLEIHHGHFVNRHMRRMDKIFKSMELFVATRQAEQCRSHHQKMEKKYHNFIAIIANLRNIHYSSPEIEPLLHDMARADVFPH